MAKEPDTLEQLHSKPVSAAEALKLINQHFSESPKLHHFYKCKGGCSKHKNGARINNPFKHESLLSKDIAFCHKTGLWWLLYEEGNGMFCLLCIMHDCENPFNKQKKFNHVPAVRYKKSALVGKDGHSSSQQHKMAIERELNKRVSYFHKEYVINEKSKDMVLYNAFLSPYWLAKEEVTNRKFKSLLQLEELLGVSQIHRFQHRPQGSQRELFLFLGQALKNNLLKKVNAANCYGLLVDEATDVTVVEQLISFIQFVNPESGAPKVHFLSAQNVLETSTSANADTKRNY